MQAELISNAALAILYTGQLDRSIGDVSPNYEGCRNINAISNNIWEDRGEKIR